MKKFLILILISTINGTSTLFAEALESICGGIDDLQPVEQYDGTLGVTNSFVNAYQSTVGQIQWNFDLGNKYPDTGNVLGLRSCSGTLISSNLFITAGHCFEEINGLKFPKTSAGNTISAAEAAINMHVNFNYQVDSNGVPRSEQSFTITDLIEYKSGGLDFAIVKLSGNPNKTFGEATISTNDANIGDTVALMAHPAGQRKLIEAGLISNFKDNVIGYNDIDTLGGSSGAGIRHAPSGTIVGVHTNGGCTNSGYNRGVPITSMITASPTLQMLTAKQINTQTVKRENHSQ